MICAGLLQKYFADLRRAHRLLSGASCLNMKWFYSRSLERHFKACDSLVKPNIRQESHPLHQALSAEKSLRPSRPLYRTTPVRTRHCAVSSSLSWTSSFTIIVEFIIIIMIMEPSVTPKRQNNKCIPEKPSFSYHHLRRIHSNILTIVTSQSHLRQLRSICKLTQRATPRHLTTIT